uniref:Glycine rich superfamily member n=1 Tax=Rhipicephalus zambeziensis TaxID=60191 RepID=A0A224YKH6_9ACAR
MTKVSSFHIILIVTICVVSLSMMLDEGSFGASARVQSSDRPRHKLRPRPRPRPMPTPREPANIVSGRSYEVAEGSGRSYLGGLQDGVADYPEYHRFHEFHEYNAY